MDLLLKIFFIIINNSVKIYTIFYVFETYFVSTHLKRKIKLSFVGEEIKYIKNENQDSLFYMNIY
jgi:hypothetical protein